jgi:hypothetical protein
MEYDESQQETINKNNFNEKCQEKENKIKSKQQEPKQRSQQKKQLALNQPHDKLTVNQINYLNKVR